MAVECALKIEAYGTSGLDLIFQHGVEGVSLQFCGGQEELIAAASLPALALSGPQVRGKGVSILI